MVIVLKDFHLSHAGIDLTEPDPALRTDQYQDYNKAILAHYGIGGERFLSSLSYYEGKPQILDSIYSRVIDLLNLELVPYQKKQEHQTKMPIAE